VLLLRKLYSGANLYSDDVIDDVITIRENQNFHLRLFVKGGSLHRTSVLIMEIACSRSATVWTLGRHRSNVALIWYCMKRVVEYRLHNSPSGRPQLVSGHRKEKTESVLI